MNPTTDERLQSRIDTCEISADGCWLWSGAVCKKGYGRHFTYVDGRQKDVVAHRAVYSALVGPIPDGLVLDHLCRVRRCVNPEHLEPVTAEENTRRGTEARPTCGAGHPYTAENSGRRTVVSNGKPYEGIRYCRVCACERGFRYRERQANQQTTAQ